MKKMNYLLLLFISVFLFSCSSDTLEEGIDNLPQEKIEFIYNGTAYSSTFKQVTDSTVVLDDANADAVYQDMCNNPNLGILVRENGDIEYYGDRLSLKNVLNIDESKLKTYDSRNKRELILDLYSEQNYSGKSIQYRFKDNFEDGDLRNRSFNDEMGSFNYHTAPQSGSSYEREPSFVIVTFYQDFHYTGHEITFMGITQVASEHMEYKLPGSKKVWHKRVSSLKVGMEWPLF